MSLCQLIRVVFIRISNKKTLKTSCLSSPATRALLTPNATPSQQTPLRHTLSVWNLVHHYTPSHHLSKYPRTKRDRLTCLLPVLSAFLLTCLLHLSHQLRHPATGVHLCLCARQINISRHPRVVGLTLTVLVNKVIDTFLLLVFLIPPMDGQ